MAQNRKSRKGGRTRRGSRKGTSGTGPVKNDQGSMSEPR